MTRESMLRTQSQVRPSFYVRKTGYGFVCFNSKYNGNVFSLYVSFFTMSQLAFLISFFNNQHSLLRRRKSGVVTAVKWQDPRQPQGQPLLASVSPTTESTSHSIQLNSQLPDDSCLGPASDSPRAKSPFVFPGESFCCLRIGKKHAGCLDRTGQMGKVRPSTWPVRFNLSMPAALPRPPPTAGQCGTAGRTRSWEFPNGLPSWPGSWLPVWFWTSDWALVSY